MSSKEKLDLPLDLFVAASYAKMVSHGTRFSEVGKDKGFKFKSNGRYFDLEYDGNSILRYEYFQALNLTNTALAWSMGRCEYNDLVKAICSCTVVDDSYELFIPEP